MTVRACISVLGVGVAILAVAETAAKPLDAEIRWTRFGVPHVKAADYESLGFGYGYAVASHRLCLLADRILTLRGERSRWFGADAAVVAGFVPTTNLNSDLFHRVQLSAEDVAAATASLSAAAREISSGYAAGFSQYVGELTEQQRSKACNGAPIPLMRQSDVVRAMMSIGVNWKAFQVLPFAASSALPQQAPAENDKAAPMNMPPSFGSNSWAYGADAAGTSGAIVMANPHTFWHGNWLSMHQLHLTIPGQLDVAGADFAGLPLPVVGFNNDVAWSIEAPMTVTYYVLQKMQIDLAGQPVYIVDGKRRELRRVPILLDVKQPDGSLARREFLVLWSELGALYQLPETPQRPAGWYAVTDAGAGNASGLDQLLAMARASTTARLRDAVVRHRGLGSHIIAGDRNGDALYVEAGPILDIDAAALARCGIKGAAFNIFDGSRSVCVIRDRRGNPRLAKSDQQPAVMTRGIVQNVNNSYHHSIYGRTLQGFSPLLGESDQHDLRLPMSNLRMRESLQDGMVTAAEALAVVFDNRNYAAEMWLDDILRACVPPNANELIERACRILTAWDRKNDATSRGALLFHSLWPQIAKIPGLIPAADPQRPLIARSLDPAPEHYPRIIKAIEAAVAELGEFKLAGDEPWGKILAARTDGGVVPLHGGAGEAGVLNVLSGSGLSESGYAQIVMGSSYLQLVRWEHGRVLADVVLAQGQSDDPESEHATDQLQLFANKQLVRLPFTDAQISNDPALRRVRIRGVR